MPNRASTKFVRANLPQMENNQNTVIMHGSGAMTWAAWVKPASATGFQWIFETATNTTTWSTYFRQNASLQFQAGRDGPSAGDNHDETSTAVAFTVGQWTHIAVTYANGTQTTRPIVYKNGAVLAMTQNNAGFGTVRNGRCWNIGERILTDGFNYDGSIAYIQFFREYALSAQHILDIMYRPGSIRRQLSVYVPVLSNRGKDLSATQYHANSILNLADDLDGPPNVTPVF